MQHTPLFKATIWWIDRRSTSRRQKIRLRYSRSHWAHSSDRKHPYGKLRTKESAYVRTHYSQADSVVGQTGVVVRLATAVEGSLNRVGNVVLGSSNGLMATVVGGTVRGEGRVGKGKGDEREAEERGKHGCFSGLVTCVLRGCLGGRVQCKSNEREGERAWRERKSLRAGGEG